MSDKPLCLVTAPVATRSGYGSHSRDICRSLIKLDRFDVKIWPVRWGNTPMNALDPNDENDIANAMQEMYFNTEKRTELKKNCEVRKASFSWDKAAEKVWNILEQNFLC